MCRFVRCSLMIVLFLSASCGGKEPSVETSPIVDVQIRIDWSRCGFLPKGATVLFYPSDGNPPEKVLMNGGMRTVGLRAGTYSVVVFNETYGDFESLLFRGTEQYETFEVYSKPDPRVVSGAVPCVESPDLFAVACCDRFEVVAASRLDPPVRLLLQPVSLNIEIHITGAVKGIRSVRSVWGTIRDLGEGFLLLPRCVTSREVSHRVDFIPVAVPNAPNTGVLKASLRSFGFPSRRVLLSDSGTLVGQTPMSWPDSLTIDLSAELVDGTLFCCSSQAMPQQTVEPGGIAGMTLVFDTLLLPDVDSEESVGSVFDAEVSDWGEPESVDIGI